MRRILFPLILGLGGIAILLNLGFWQLRRLEWKESILATIAARIDAPPEQLPPEGADGQALKYTPVRVAGRTTGQELHMLTGRQGVGPGFEVIAAFETADGRRILLDRGFIPETAKDMPRPPVDLDVTGNIHWPDETTASTPAPDIGRNIWFARDVPAMAAALETEPLMVAARSVDGAGQGVVPVPISVEGIRNDHLNYAITWFSLAGVWAGMTGYLLWRIRRRTI
ncbi:SURF1 family protein [Frigidibacter oleivorans]|uniref:SURF1 family protein n=1 Tax=Frigidibacter oleivorans TaxID=2487129 RepID=UPI000F8C9CEC|nr:SURF1 family protein [Frigidibacter oleivorans]